MRKKTNVERTKDISKYLTPNQQLFMRMVRRVLRKNIQKRKLTSVEFSLWGVTCKLASINGTDNFLLTSEFSKFSFEVTNPWHMISALRDELCINYHEWLELSNWFNRDYTKNEVKKSLPNYIKVYHLKQLELC